jgi:hypothetical protein
VSGSQQIPPSFSLSDVNGLFCHDLPTRPLRDAGTVLVSGASGYIGGRLVPELLARNYQVRTMVRADPSACAVRWPGVESVEADALNPESLRKAQACHHRPLRCPRAAWEDLLVPVLAFSPLHFSGLDSTN